MYYHRCYNPGLHKYGSLGECIEENVTTTSASNGNQTTSSGGGGGGNSVVINQIQTLIVNIINNPVKNDLLNLVTPLVDFTDGDSKAFDDNVMIEKINKLSIGIIDRSASQSNGTTQSNSDFKIDLNITDSSNNIIDIVNDDVRKDIKTLLDEYSQYKIPQDIKDELTTVISDDLSAGNTVMFKNTDGQNPSFRKTSSNHVNV